MMEKQTFKERIRKADSTVKEAKDFFLMQTSFYFSGLSHLINQKYPEWVFEKIMEEYENEA